MSGREHALFEIVEDDDADGAAEPAKRALVQLGPDLRARAPHQEPHRFARVAERQDKQPRAPVLAGLRVAHHRAVAVIDLAFFAGRRGDHDARFGRRRAAELRDEAPDAGVPRGEAVIVDEVLPDRHRVAAAPQRLGDQLAVRLAGARARRTTRPGDGAKSVDTSAGGNGRCLAGAESVDTSSRNCRFWFCFARTAAAAHRDPGRLQVPADRLAADTGRLLDPARASSPSRPSARICCCLSSSKTLLMPAKNLRSSPASTSRPASVNCRF